MLEPLNPQSALPQLEQVEIDLTAPATMEDGVAITPNADGTIEVNLDPGADEEEAEHDVSEHDANLAEALDENELAKIAQRVIELVEADEQSRLEWKQRFDTGLQAIGLAKRGDDYVPAFPGAADVVYPLLMEATIQFQARALEELFPANGPVKTEIVGQKTKEVQEQADRVADHMNYQVTIEDQGYFNDLDQMLLYLPLGGSAFKKTWWDPVKRRTMTRHVKGDRVILPYLSSDISDTPRITHELHISPNTLKKQIKAKYYREVTLTEPEETPSSAGVAIDATDDKSPVVADREGMHIAYECHTEYDLPGKLADPDGIARPYIITVDKNDQKVLSIRRNWREDDEAQERRDWFTHYKFFPGLGVYGYGWFHTIGGLGDAASGTLNAILDAAAFATMQGGFKAKDTKMPGGQMTIEPGVYKDIDMTSEELAKAFFTPNFKEPSTALFQALSLMVDIGKRFAMTTDATVGDGANTGPVGTTVAMIEQASKLMTGIHKRLHNSMGHEFRLRAELNGDHLDDEYPFSIKGEEKRVLRADYDGRVDVIPVSDPNISSNTQRIAIAQSVFGLSKEAPELYDSFKVHKMMLTALKVPQMDELLKDPSKVARADPVSEGQMILSGLPIKVFPDQDHDAHIAVHRGLMDMLAGSPMEQMVGNAMMAHMADHMGHKYRNQLSQMIGVPLPPLSEGKPQEMDPRMENMIAAKSAMAINQMKQQAQGGGGQAEGQPNPNAAKVQADIQMKGAAAQAEAARKDALAKAEIERKDALAKAESARKDAELAAELQRDAMRDQTDNHRRDRQDFIDMQREGNANEAP